MRTVAELIVLLKAKFPNAWFKEGAEFGDGYELSVWTGEGSYVNGLPMFNDESTSEIYDMGVHTGLINFVEKYGYYVESYDAGTFFIVPE